MTEFEKFKYQLLAHMLYIDSTGNKNQGLGWRELTSEEKDVFYKLAKEENNGDK